MLANQLLIFHFFPEDALQLHQKAMDAGVTAIVIPGLHPD